MFNRAGWVRIQSIKFFSSTLPRIFSTSKQIVEREKERERIGLLVVGGVGSESFAL